MNTDLDNTFEVEVIEPVSVDGRALVRHEVKDIDKNVDDDYEATRANLHMLLEQGNNALAKAWQVAMSSEHPTAFEVAGQIMKNLADINGQLLELSEKRMKLMKADGKGDTSGKTVNNTIFVGTNAELAKALRGDTE